MNAAVILDSGTIQESYVRIGWKNQPEKYISQIVEEVVDGQRAGMLQGNKRGKTEAGGAATLAGKNWVTGVVELDREEVCGVG